MRDIVLTPQKSFTGSLSNASLADGLLSRNLTYISNLGFYEQQVRTLNTIKVLFVPKADDRQMSINTYVSQNNFWDIVRVLDGSLEFVEELSVKQNGLYLGTLTDISLTT